MLQKKDYLHRAIRYVANKIHINALSFCHSLYSCSVLHSSRSNNVFSISASFYIPQTVMVSLPTISVLVNIFSSHDLFFAGSKIIKWPSVALLVSIYRAVCSRPSSNVFVPRFILSSMTMRCFFESFVWSQDIQQVNQQVSKTLTGIVIANLRSNPEKNMNQLVIYIRANDKMDASC